MKMKGFISVVIIALLFTLNAANAQGSKFKALFIYKFAEYIEWPSQGNEATVGVVGNSDVYEQLKTLAGQKQNLSVIQVENPSDATKCSILYLPLSQKDKTQAYSTAIGNSSVLIVSDEGELTGKGVDIGFYLEGGRLRFFISEEDIKAKKMLPSSKLLALGKAI